jgi:protein-L-isoaspartate(D-aspartate) O-methyltransferase
MVDLADARRNMVDCQLRTNRITDPAVIEAFETVPREEFVDDRHRSVAYADEDLPLGNGRYLMEPMVFARLVQALEISENDIVLDIGAGTGYSAAILARHSATVVAIESDSSLSDRANKTLTDIAVDNAVVIEAPLAEGYPGQGPYGVICIEGSVSDIPDNILDQLAEGGRLAAVVDKGTGPGCAMLFLKKDGLISKRTLFDANIPGLPEFKNQPGFVF